MAGETSVQERLKRHRADLAQIEPLWANWPIIEAWIASFQPFLRRHFPPEDFTQFDGLSKKPAWQHLPSPSREHDREDNWELATNNALTEQARANLLAFLDALLEATPEPAPEPPSQPEIGSAAGELCVRAFLWRPRRCHVQRKPPLPLAQAFVVCRTVYQDRRTGEFLLVGPFNGIALHFFPAGFRLSLYAHLTGGHGTYDLALELRDAEGEAGWGWRWPEPIRHPDPLEPYRVSLHDAVVEFPRPGR